MTEIELLRGYLADERKAVKALSADEHGYRPLTGCEDEHRRVRDKIDLLELMITRTGEVKRLTSYHMKAPPVGLAPGGRQRQNFTIPS